MTLPRLPSCWLLLPVLQLGTGCAQTATDDDDSAVSDDDDSTEDTLDPALLASPGPATVEETAGFLVSAGGCELDYTLFSPSDGGPLLVLAHGFQRSAAEMADHARHLASWGLTVATPELCHSSFSDSDPEANAADMVELAATLQPSESVGYAGHSAGGLAALIAASTDARTGALVGLDLVDNGPGPAAAAALAAPAYGIFGEPGSCNADGNGVAVLAGAAEARLGRLTDADHCDFESPTGPLCTAICRGGNDSFDDPTITAAVRALMTGALLDRLALEPAASTWWEGSEGAALSGSGLWVRLD